MTELSIFPDEVVKPSAALYHCEPWYPLNPPDCAENGYPTLD